MSFRGRVKNWFLRRFNVVDISEKAGIQWLSVAGMLGDRIEAMGELAVGEEGFLEWSASFFRAALPWFTTREDEHMRRKLIAWLDSYEIYTSKIKPWADGTIPLDNLNVGAKGKTENEGTSTSEKEEALKKVYYELDTRTTEIELSESRTKNFLISDAKILLADSFKKAAIASSATYVVSKSEIPGPGKEHGEALEGFDMVASRIATMSNKIDELEKRLKTKGA